METTSNDGKTTSDMQYWTVHGRVNALFQGPWLKAAFVQSQPRTHEHLKQMNDVPNHCNRVIAPGGSQTELLHMSVPLHGFG